MRRFKTIKQVDLTIFPVQPILRLHPRKLLQIERPNRDEATHTGGFDTNVTVEGFIGHKYGDLVIAQALERKDELGTSPQDMDFRAYTWLEVEESSVEMSCIIGYTQNEDALKV